MTELSIKEKYEMATAAARRKGSEFLILFDKFSNAQKQNEELRLALTKADLIFQAAERQRGPIRYAAEDWRKEYSHLVTEPKG
jgi:hypothetical protein